ncbi:hypothetical protein NQ015_09955 [Corynebacterium sp. 153RC1]|uniref:hypothetical protein n=1 Tax=unclassified Corynebacterium TaxID=2624378 RepID=UPI00211C0FE3|nr:MULTISPECIES: hypothetical protein [unclassified Corynebacterium]MCQ9371376.1 hypothetical protein [Corynebacterium sp. 35RC1]MCQ9353298.1 hypothetical protein [Corynebacterium sp. 209RC1]MCQ9355562.1 hypothetical protein [Corynebacterium sp. 1222RC1]MCQ9357747.1 hypothetical protein [Corynebacterium sp. 122RC1]MCQ9359934.1 hypothetical protein [Corynebacterium sp. 142RC1]
MLKHSVIPQASSAITTLLLQLVMLTNPAPADAFSMSIGAAFFTIARTTALLQPAARKSMLLSVLFTMLQVGMRFDGSIATTTSGQLFTACT